MKRSHTKLIAYLGMLALLASLIMGLLGFSNNSKDVARIKNQLLRHHVENNINLTLKYISKFYGDLTQGDETLLDIEGNSIKGRFEAVDSIWEDLGDKSTIFVKVNDDFMRISTNITDDEGERVIGTFLGIDHSAYNTVMRGEIYIGEAEILGERYYTAYKPIKDNNNNVIGLLFVGMPMNILDNIVKTHDEKMDIINIFIIILRAISLGSLIFLSFASLNARKCTPHAVTISRDCIATSDGLSLVSDKIREYNLNEKIEDLKHLKKKLNDNNINIEEVNSLIEEQIATMEQISKSSTELSELTDALNKIVNKNL